jgi:hypothetical protein
MTGLGAVSKAHGGDVRRIVHLRALLVGHGFCRGVTILDYSTSGLRLADTFALAVGERVTVELLTGHRLPVVVAWAVGSQMEVRFVGQIVPGHPALLPLDAAAERYRQRHTPIEYP